MKFLSAGKTKSKFLNVRKRLEYIFKCKKVYE